MRQVLRDYHCKVKLIFRNLPLPFHPGAKTAAKAFSAVCLQGSGLAYAYQSELFANQDRVKKEGETYLIEAADKIGVDIQRLKRDMDGSEVSEILQDDKQRADALNVKGTPSFKIGNEELKGAYPYSEFKKVIDRQLGL